MPDAFVVIIPEETLQAFTHPAIDLTSGQLVELEAEPAPVQLELFTEALDTAVVVGLSPEARH